MSTDQVWSFSDELSAMSTILERACKMTSTLRALHEAEVHSAMREMNVKVQELRYQLSSSQQALGLPEEVLRAKSLSDDMHPFGAATSARERDGCEDTTPKPIWSSENNHLPVPDMPPPVLPLTGAMQAFGRDPESPTMLGFLHKTTERLELRATATTSSPPSWRAGLEPILSGGLRDIWAGASEESLNILTSRCRVHLEHYENENDVFKGFGSRPSLASSGFVNVASMSAAAVTAGQRTYVCAFGIIDPIGPTRSVWNVLSLIFIAYDLLVVPMQAFAVEEEKALQVFEWLLTVWWTFDVYMTFRTGYVVGLKVEMRPRKIAIHYAKSWLLCDSIIVVLEWVNRFAVAFGSVSLLRSSRSLRALRYVRLFRASKIHSFWNTLKEQVNSNVMHLCMTMTVLAGVLLLAVHVTACVWYAIGDSRGDGWTTYDVYEGSKDKFYWYVTSFRWVISQLNGRTDMDENRNMVERFYTVIVGISLAVIAHAVFISYITKIMLDLSELVSEKTSRRRAVNHYLEANPLPPLLTAQIKRALLDYQDIDQELRKEDQVLAILPNHMKTDVLEEVRSPVLVQHPLFHALAFESHWVMRLICSQVVQTVSTSKDEVVFDKGDVCERMLFTDKLTVLYGTPADPSVWCTKPDPFMLDAEPHDHFAKHVCASGSSHGTVHKSRLNRAKTLFGRTRPPTRDSLDLLESAPGRAPKTIGMGGWISEVALWLEWRNEGRLISNGHGVILAVKASRLAHALKNHPDAFALAYIHGSNVAAELFSTGQRELADVLPFEVQLHSPLRVNVTVISAKGLRNADTFLFGKSDPYCVCNVVGVTGKSSEMRFKTRTIGNSLDPVWNHSAEVFLSFHQQIEFQIYDADFGKHDASLGVARVSSEQFASNGFQGDLQLRTLDGGPSQGCVSIKIQVMDLEETALVRLWPARPGRKNVIRKTISQNFERRASKGSVGSHLS